MHNLTAQRQGQPVLFLCLLAAGWVLLRWVTWENPWSKALAVSEVSLFAAENVTATKISRARNIEAKHKAEMASSDQLTMRNLTVARHSGQIARSRQAKGEQMMPDAHIGGHRNIPEPSAAVGPSQTLTGLKRAEWAEETSVSSKPVSGPSRWRADGWLVLREGSSTLAEGGRLPASYGGSQAGVALAYRLAPTSQFAPTAYFRTNRNFGSPGETDSALGLRVRPLGRVQIEVQMEARITHHSNTTEVRPAALVPGGFEDGSLPIGLLTRGYGQAGYVGGDFATAFADGALVAERETTTLGGGALSIGAGAWGGAQKGASRVDVGPTVALKFMAKDGPVRLEAGYRLRVAGNARPENSGVLTLSTGF